MLCRIKRRVRSTNGHRASNSLLEDSPASLATTNSGPRLSQGKNCAATPVRQWLSDCNGSKAASTLEKSAHNFDFAKCQVNSFNVRGWSCNQQEKQDFIANYLLKQEYPTIICVQETWETQNTEIEIDGCYLIGSGTETNSRSHGGVSIALCPKATKAWKKAGKDPLRFPVLAEATRTIVLELLFSDARGKPVPVRVASVYAPCSWRTIEEFDTTLEQVSSLVDTTPKDTLLFIGGDFNAGIDIANARRRKITGPLSHPVGTTIHQFP